MKVSTGWQAYTFAQLWITIVMKADVAPKTHLDRFVGQDSSKSFAGIQITVLTTIACSSPLSEHAIISIRPF